MSYLNNIYDVYFSTVKNKCLKFHITVSASLQQNKYFVNMPLVIVIATQHCDNNQVVLLDCS